ncbi:histone-lysine N-methyltransferase SETMAR [Trichonephila clavipes]|nr:histone-lysine N-methyltransferase SETMAR [Trichonephila clavipes]
MESDKQHFRHILLFYYRKGKNAVQARKKLTDVYGEGVLTVRQCQNWFAKFRSGNFDVEDAPRSGRPLLPDNTINSEVYCHQLDKLNDALQQKRSELINRKGLVFHQDNARPHTSLVTRQKLLQLEWDTMSHPLYSPELAPLDYYLFRSLQNFLDDGDRFNSCQVIYSQFGLAIHQNDHQARRRFVEWAQNEIAVVPDCHRRILFSDEAHFWLNGYVNKQNCRIWSEANLQVYVETPLYPEKLTVWCALWAGGILLQKR